jgi:hypothetical protein
MEIEDERSLLAIFQLKIPYGRYDPESLNKLLSKTCEIYNINFE